MRVEFKLLIVVTLLVFPVVANAQFRPAKCDVQPLWVNAYVRSSNFGLMGSFDVVGYETIRSFRLVGTNLIATAGISYDEDHSKDKLHRIRLAITVSDKEEKEIFESIASSEASTQYRKGWSIAATKNINFDDRIYMFTLRCWDAAIRRPYL